MSLPLSACDSPLSLSLPLSPSLSLREAEEEKIPDHCGHPAHARMQQHASTPRSRKTSPKWKRAVLLFSHYTSFSLLTFSSVFTQCLPSLSFSVFIMQLYQPLQHPGLQKGTVNVVNKFSHEWFQCAQIKMSSNNKTQRK